MKSNNAVEGCIGLGSAFIVVVVVSYVVNGFVLATLWSWFVVPLFLLPQLLIPQAIGLSMIMGFLTQGHTDTNNKNKEMSEVISDALAKLLFYPIMILGIAWIVSQFI